MRGAIRDIGRSNIHDLNEEAYCKLGQHGMKKYALEVPISAKQTKNSYHVLMYLDERGSSAYIRTLLENYITQLMRNSDIHHFTQAQLSLHDGEERPVLY